MRGKRSITTLSSREFNQATRKAKKAAERGPVFITDRGRPSHVLLTIRDYQALVGPSASIVDLLALPPGAEESSSSSRASSAFIARRTSPTDVLARHQRRLGAAQGACWK